MAASTAPGANIRGRQNESGSLSVSNVSAGLESATVNEAEAVLGVGLTSRLVVLSMVSVLESPLISSSGPGSSVCSCTDGSIEG